MAIRTRLVSKSHSMFGLAICICSDTFCSWLLPVVWRSVKLIKSWQQDKTFGIKTLKPLWHFLLCLLWWYLYSSGSNQLSVGDHCIIALYLFIHNDTRGKFSYKNWQLFIAQSSEDDLTFETDGRWATCLERFMQMEKLFSNQTEKSWQGPQLRFIQVPENNNIPYLRAGPCCCNQSFFCVL